MRNSISAARGPEQGVGSLLSTPWSPSITTSPEERRPDQHCLSLSLPQSQASRRARAAHSPPDSLLASSWDWALSSLSFFSCQGARMESESPLVSLLLWAWSRAPDPRGRHKRQKRALRKQGAGGTQWILPSHLPLCCAPQVGIDSAHLGSADGTQTLV